MKTTILILLLAVLALPLLAGTNVTVKVIEDDHSDTRFHVYSHGTNVVLKIHQRTKFTSITSGASGYSVTHTDTDGDGTTDSIMIANIGDKLLEVLKRDADGTYVQTDQKELDEVNRMTKNIKTELAKRNK
jgi:hypothetical protein